MINLPCGSIIDKVWTNGMFLLTKIETPLFLLLSVMRFHVTKFCVCMIVLGVSCFE